MTSFYYVKCQITTRIMIRPKKMGLAGAPQYREPVSGFSSFEIVEFDASKKDYLKSDLNHFYFLIEGNLIVSCDRFSDVEVKSNEFFLLPASSCYTIRFKTKCKMVVFHFDYISDSWACARIEKLSGIVEMINIKFSKFSSTKGLSLFFNNIGVFEQDLKNSEFVWLKEKELYYLLFTYYSNIELYNIFYPIVSRDVNFKSFVLKNHLKVRGVSELAELSGYSLSTFKRRFIDNFGESVYSWMQRQKSMHIFHLFKNEKVVLSEIITTYGFSSPSHFTRFCKKYYGVTPTQLKEAVKEKDFVY